MCRWLSERLRGYYTPFFTGHPGNESNHPKCYRSPSLGRVCLPDRQACLSGRQGGFDEPSRHVGIYESRLSAAPSGQQCRKRPNSRRVLQSLSKSPQTRQSDAPWSYPFSAVGPKDFLVPFTAGGNGNPGLLGQKVRRQKETHFGAGCRPGRRAGKRQRPFHERDNEEHAWPTQDDVLPFMGLHKRRVGQVTNRRSPEVLFHVTPYRAVRDNRLPSGSRSDRSSPLCGPGRR